MFLFLIAEWKYCAIKPTSVSGMAILVYSRIFLAAFFAISNSVAYKILISYKNGLLIFIPFVNLSNAKPIWSVNKRWMWGSISPRTASASVIISSHSPIIFLSIFSKSFMYSLFIFVSEAWNDFSICSIWYSALSYFFLPKPMPLPTKMSSFELVLSLTNTTLLLSTFKIWQLRIWDKILTSITKTKRHNSINE